MIKIGREPSIQAGIFRFSITQATASGKIDTLVNLFFHTGQFRANWENPSVLVGV